MRINPLIGCCLLVSACLLGGCHTGPLRSVAAPSAEIQTQAAEPSGDNRAEAYYYYSAAQLAVKGGQPEEAAWLLGKAVDLDGDSLYLKVELAGLLTSNGKTDRALVLIDQVLDCKPDHLRALTLAGEIFQQRQEPEQAKQVYEKALAVNPVDQSIYILLGRLYWNDNDLTNAQRVFQRMVENIPDAYAAHYFIGKVFVSQGQFDKAVESFNKALFLDSTLEEPRLELIEIYKAQERTDRVISLYQEVLANNPDNYQIAMDLAVAYNYSGQQADANPLLFKIGQQSSQDPRIIALVFETFIETKQFEIAVWVLEGLLRGAPASSDLHYLAGVAYDGLEQIQPTLAHLTQVHTDSRFYPNAVVHSALLYHSSGEITSAIDVLRKALEDSPGNLDVHYYLGNFYEEQQRYDEAVDVLHKGLAQSAEEVRLHFKLGVVLDKMGRRLESIEAMKTVIRLAPDHTDALNYLGYTYAEMGIHLDEAEQLIRTALKNKPENGYITDSLGWVYFKRGEYDESLKWLLKALTLTPDDPAILEHIGDVYLKLNQKEQALHYYSRSLELDSGDRETVKNKIRTLSSGEVLPPAPSPDGPAHP